MVGDTRGDLLTSIHLIFMWKQFSRAINITAVYRGRQSLKNDSSPNFEIEFKFNKK